MTDKEKICSFLDFKGINKNQFYKHTGLSVGFLDSGSSLGVDKLRIILDNYPDLNPDWLIAGKGKMIKTIQDSKKPAIKNIRLVNRHMYEMYLSKYSDISFLESLPLIAFSANDKYIESEYLAFEIKGDYMDNESKHSLLSNDIVLCRILPDDISKESNFHLKKDNYYVVVTNEDIFVSYISLFEKLKNSITLHYLNPAYKDKSIPVKNILQIFKVVQIVRDVI